MWNDDTPDQELEPSEESINAREGEFERERNLRVTDAPCTVAAVVDGVSSDPVAVEDAPEDCVGTP